MSNTPTGSPGDQRPASNNKAVAIVIAAVLLVAAGVGAYFMLRSDAPARVGLENAVDDTDTTTTAAMGDETDTTTTAAMDDEDQTNTESGESSSEIDGTWKVEPSTEAPDFAQPVGSFVGFRIDEELAGIGATEAVGRTRSVTGSVTIADGKVTETTFTVDMDTITTDQSMRDSRAKEALGTAEFPTATFELSEPIDLGSDAATTPVSVKATGDLTVHGVTKPVTFAIEAKLADGKVVMTGTTDVKLSDFGVKGPTNAKVLSVSDDATVEFQFFLAK